MTLRTDKLEQYKELADLLAGWSAAASNLGATLTLVQFQTENNGLVQLSLTDAATDDAYWEIS